MWRFLKKLEVELPYDPAIMRNFSACLKDVVSACLKDVEIS